MNRKVHHRVDEDGEDMIRRVRQRVDEDGVDMNRRVHIRVDEDSEDMNRKVRQRVDEDGKDKVGSPCYLLIGDGDVALKARNSMDWTSMIYDPMLHIFTLIDYCDRASLESTCTAWRSLGEVIYLCYLAVTGTSNINWRVAAESWEKLLNLTGLA
ncbi:F-box domain-containing protein [Raphanus sativus]|nr:F-box domain-containing protein [Raphanus sativus]